MDEKILTLHPQGKSGSNISRSKYEMIRGAIVAALAAKPEMTFTQLTNSIEASLGERFEGSIPWYVITVKLDLEARNVIERVAGKSPQRLRLVEPAE